MTTIRPNKIVHLSSVHDATDTRILHKECRSLAAAGYDVTLIARASEDTAIDGVSIVSVAAPHTNRLARMTRTTFEVLRKARRENGDAYHFHDPELIPVGILLKLLGKRVVYDSHENVSKQIRSKFWIPRLLRVPVASLYRLLEQGSARLFDGVVAATPGIAHAFAGPDTIVVQNFALESEFDNVELNDYQLRPRQLAYVGGITEARGALQMIEALELVNARTPSTLALAGTFTPSSFRSRAEAQPGWRHVDAHGWLHRNDVVAVLSQSRIGLLVLHPEPNYLDSYPVKLFEYMLAGLPVVASNFPFWRQFIAEPGAGLMVDPLDPHAIADAIRWLLEHPEEAEAMGRRGREMALKHYSWEQEAEKLGEFYRNKVFA